MLLRPALGACMLTLSPLLALGQQAPAPAQQSASIIGTVVDVQHDVIPSAVVVLDGPAPADHAEIQSDEDGHFAFHNLRTAIPYHLTITAKGFAAWTSPAIILEPSEEYKLGDIQLNIAVVQTTVTAMTTEQLATQEVHIEEKQRVLGVFPNFYVVYTPHPVPLTTKLKYELALRTTIDPVNILGTAAFAGFNQAGDVPNYQEGAKGYAQRFGAAYTDGFTDIMIGGAILPSLLHQDPRYFYKGTGTIKSRIGHAIVFAVFCKGDNGRWQFNYSSVGGDLASGALSNLYYPPSNRGPGLVFDNALLSAGGRVASNLAQEFLFRKFTPSAKKQQ
jgi:Carboxypeptidase regulatory-like domain